ncbi:MAG: hypothetical protein ACE5PO_07135 [Candidatus Bathyarchaeia archaeon]
MTPARKKWLVDTVAASIFYTATYIPVYLFLAYPDWMKVAIGITYTATGELVLGGFLGRFLDWFRRMNGIHPTMP